MPGAISELTSEPTLGVSIDIFTNVGGAFLSRWLHVVVGVAWIGLLYYFNFVQVPAFAEMEGAARNNTIDKLASRALWWFRWAAVATLVSGLLLLYFQEFGDSRQLFDPDYFKTLPGIGISTGILFAITMFLNVWLVIWPNQRIVIANARNVAAGGEADPNAAAAGRRALLASRQNTVFSVPMLWFMVGTSHFPYDAFGIPEGGSRALYWVITLVIWALLELNCLGYLGGTAPGGARAIYDKHQSTIISGFVLTAVFYVLWIAIL